MGSTYINQLTIYGRNFYVVAQADTAFRSDIHAFSNYYVKNINGEMIPLSTIVSYKLTESAPLISHFNIYRSAEIDGGAKPGTAAVRLSKRWSGWRRKCCRRATVMTGRVFGFAGDQVGE